MVAHCVLDFFKLQNRTTPAVVTIFMQIVMSDTVVQTFRNERAMV